MTGTKTTKEKLKSWPKDRNKVRASLHCLCPYCPTYKKAIRDPEEDVFCLMGMSFKNIDQEEVCSCTVCDVQKDLNFNHIFHCMRGSEKDQRYDDEQGSSSRGSG